MLRLSNQSFNQFVLKITEKVNVSKRKILWKNQQ